MNKPFLDKITDWHNKISDNSAIWFPFVFLKPKPEEKITSKRYILMVFFFTSYTWLFFLAKEYYFQSHIDWQVATKNYCLFLIAFALWFKLITCFFWNKRAYTLKKNNLPTA